jgi:hypothetical protein
VRYGTVAGVRRHLMGCVPDRRDHRDDPFTAAHEPHLLAKQLPPSFEQWAKLPRVRDQGALGTCVTFGALGAGAFLETSKGLPDPELSHEDFYAAARMYEGVPLTEDSGLQIRDALKVWARRGVCLEKTRPYADKDGSFSRAPTPNEDAEAEKHRILVYVRLPNLRMVKSALLSRPVVFGTPLPESVRSDSTTKTGEILYPERNEGFVSNHCMLAAAFDDHYKFSNGDVGAIFGLNSWGKTWGWQGRFKLSYRFWMSGLVLDNWMIVVDNDGVSP